MGPSTSGGTRSPTRVGRSRALACRIDRNSQFDHPLARAVIAESVLRRMTNLPTKGEALRSGKKVLGIDEFRPTLEPETSTRGGAFKDDSNQCPNSRSAAM
jgi:hypothetical protein